MTIALRRAASLSLGLALPLLAAACTDASQTSAPGAVSSALAGKASSDFTIIHWPLPIFHTPVTDVSLGDDGHGCFRASDGSVACWGNNGSGQLGDGTTTARPKPVAVVGITNALHVATTNAGSCALLGNGTVECWGALYNVSQLGSSVAPVPVPGVTGAVAIAGGDRHYCVLEAWGGVVCWGYNSAGQIGVNSPTYLDPSSVPNVSNAVAIAVGTSQSCALLQSGGVTCWGSNRNMQLGLPQSYDINVPPTTLGFTNVRQVSAYGDNTCVLGLNGVVTCFGGDLYCSDGIGTNCGWGTGPTTIAGLGYATSIAASNDHNCAQMSDGSVRCWGLAASLGDGNTALAYRMGNPVAAAQGARGIVGGPWATCAMDAFDVQCWGASEAFTLSATPTTIY